MKRFYFILILAVMASLISSEAMADSRGRIYGKIITVDGDEFEGLIRWDKNEGSWFDILNGNKELPHVRKRSRRKRYRERDKSIEIFGLSIGRTRFGGYGYDAAQSGVSFGHIESIEILDDDAALIRLKTGHEVEFESGSTDIGEGIREIVIEDRKEGEFELDWNDIETIKFMQAPSGLESEFGERLYGTLTTRRGDKYTGWVCWDVDELFEEDVLDGEQKRRDREVKFGQIASIERRSGSSANITLKKGREMVLRGTNDVDSSNRGIVIYVESFGEVKVDWDEFDRLDFENPPKQVEYDKFDGGYRLEGTVYTEDGEEYTGKIRWDDDEEWSWEILDGEFRDIEYDIEFKNIKEIQRKGYSSAIVTIWDGHEFRLKDSNDVDDDNKGIFIELPDGDEIEVFWDEFDRIVFKK